ncbi:MAG: TonB family protein [bacterium]|nr:TonB family protein [bacterium]
MPEKNDAVFIFFPDNRYGLINGSGDIVVQPQYDGILEFGEGLAGVRTGSKWGFIGKDGKFLIKPRFQYIKDSFSDGLACVMENYKYGYIDKQGQWKIKSRFDDAESFHDGLARVEIGGKLGFIDTGGQVVINPEFGMVAEFSEGLAAAEKLSLGKWGYIDKKGNMVIPPTYDITNPFSEGLALVDKNGELLFIDKTGKVVLDLKYDFVQDFSEGLAAVTINKKVGYINHAGEVVIPLRFDSGSSFSEGLAAVEVGRLSGFIDTKGKMVIEPKFLLAIFPFKNGLTMVVLGKSGRKGIAGYIDKKGTIIKKWLFDPNDLVKGSGPPVNMNAAPAVTNPTQSLPPLVVGGNTGIPSPKIIKNVSPEYPKEAVENRTQGLVVVNLEIDIYGRVTGAHAFEGPELLRDAAEKAIKQWVFEPTIINGVPRRVKQSVILTFKL